MDGLIDIRRAAMDLLARREHARRELTDKLALRFDDRAAIQQVVDRLAEERLQSDERFTEAFIHGRAQRLYGPQRIRAELRQRGIAEESIESAFAQAAIDWDANLRRLTIAKFGRRPPVDGREQAKRLRYLQYRGFAPGRVRQFWNTADAFD